MAGTTEFVEVSIACSGVDQINSSQKFADLHDAIDTACRAVRSPTRLLHAGRLLLISKFRII